MPKMTLPKALEIALITGDVNMVFKILDLATQVQEANRIRRNTYGKPIAYEGW